MLISGSFYAANIIIISKLNFALSVMDCMSKESCSLNICRPTAQIFLLAQRAYLLFSLDILFSMRVIKVRVWAQAVRSAEITSGPIRTTYLHSYLKTLVTHAFV